MLTGGLDEVGWGALAGPIISAVFTIDHTNFNMIPQGTKDSKQVNKVNRERLYMDICAVSAEIGIGWAWPEEVDVLGPLPALQLSYRRALKELHHQPELLIVDGSNSTNRVQGYGGEQLVEPKADARHKVVSAASIVAKVFRDRLMEQESMKMRDKYGWARNSGYGTPDHEEAILKHGLLITRPFYFHRQRYCRKFLGG